VDKIFTPKTHHRAHLTTAAYAYLIKVLTATFYSELFMAAASDVPGLIGYGTTFSRIRSITDC
jgi:hypothetical protein